MHTNFTPSGYPPAASAIPAYLGCMSSSAPTSSFSCPRSPKRVRTRHHSGCNSSLGRVQQMLETLDYPTSLASSSKDGHGLSNGKECTTSNIHCETIVGGTVLADKALQSSEHEDTATNDVVKKSFGAHSGTLESHDRTCKSPEILPPNKNKPTSSAPSKSKAKIGAENVEGISADKLEPKSNGMESVTSVIATGEINDNKSAPTKSSLNIWESMDYSDGKKHHTEVKHERRRKESRIETSFILKEDETRTFEERVYGNNTLKGVKHEEMSTLEPLPATESASTDKVTHRRRLSDTQAMDVHKGEDSKTPYRKINISKVKVHCIVQCMIYNAM